MLTTATNGNDFGTGDAILVQTASGIDVAGLIAGQNQVQFDFDYDGNVQGGRPPATDANITVVAIGLDTSQHVLARGTIERSTSNSVSLVAPLERNYENA